MSSSQDLEFDHKILVVEAEIKRAKNITYVLDGLYETKLVNSAENAIAYLEETEKYPDLILSNTNFISADDYLQDLEKLDGLSFVKYLKNSANLKNIPVIFLTSNEDSIYISRLFNEGASDVVPLPHDNLDIFARIETRIEKEKERNELSSSFQDLMEDMKSRNKKNLDFRSQLFAKHRESISKYEAKITKLRELLIDRNKEIEFLKDKVMNLSQENGNLQSDIKYLKVKLYSSQQIEHTVDAVSSINNMSEAELVVIEDIFNHLNQEYLFEEELIRTISKKILVSDIDFKKIDNFSFIKGVTKSIKKHTKREFFQVVDEQNLRKQIASNIDNLLDYILKNYINKFLFFFAINLLENVGTKSENAIRFLRFYDGRVEIDPNGVRYQKPTISSAEGSWNMVTIIQIINQRTNGYSIIKKQEETIQRYKESMDRTYKNFVELASTYKVELDKTEPIVEQFIHTENILKEMRDESKNLAEKEKCNHDIEKIEVFRMDYEKLRTQKDSFVSKYAKQVTYYKPTEEKFTKIALSVAKILLKVKVV
jgi:CheY-like chemotaxis protein